LIRRQELRGSDIGKKQITPQAFSDGMKLYEAKMLKK